MNLRIAIVELYQHQGDVDYLATVLSHLGRVTLFVTPAYAKTYAPGGEVVTVSTAGGLRGAIQELSQRVQGFDLVVNATTMLDFRAWRSLSTPGVPWVTLVHNARWMLSERLVWAPLKPVHVLRRLKWSLTGELSHRREISSHFSGLVFPSSHIVAQFAESAGKASLGVPWAVWGSAAHQLDAVPNDAPPTILVPGTVLPEQRDYQLLGRALRELPAAVAPIHVVILGEARSAGARDAMKALSSELRTSDTLTTFDRLVPDEVYAQAWRRATCIVSLTGRDMPFATTYEGGGSTKVTGIENDQIRYARPILTPASYRGMPELSAWQTTFETAEDLRRLIEASIDGGLNARPAPAGLSLEDHISVWHTFLQEVLR